MDKKTSGHERWDFDRLVASAASQDSGAVEAVLDQFRLRAANWNEEQRITALEIAQRLHANPIDVTVGAAARDLISALSR